MHPIEKKWDKRCFEVFSQELDEMHQELSKDGEDHKLWDVKITPLDLHTRGLHMSNCNILIFTKIKNFAFIACSAFVCAFGLMNFTKIENLFDYTNYKVQSQP